MSKTTKIDRVKIKDMYGGRCAYCGAELSGKFHIDHVNPVVRRSDIKLCEKTGRMKMVSTTETCHPDNHHIDNLKPSCVPCNIHKSSMNLEQFRQHLSDHILMLNKASNYSIYRHAKRFGLVQETGKEIRFYFEDYLNDR